MRFVPMVTLAATSLATGAVAQDATTDEIIGPTYGDAPEMAVNPSQPMGTLRAFVMLSQHQPNRVPQLGEHILTHLSGPATARAISPGGRQ